MHMDPRAPFDPILLARLPLPLAALYALTFRARADRDRHDRALHLAEASLKLLAAALMGRYRSCGMRSGQVDAAIQNIVMPALGDWWDIAREALLFLGEGCDARSWSGEVLAFCRAPFADGRSCEALSVLAELAGNSGRFEASAFGFFGLLPAYRNAMSNAHGGIKSDPAIYERGTWALLHLVRSLHEDGGLLGGGRLALAEEVKFTALGEIQMLCADLTGPSAVRRFDAEDGDVRGGILPGSLYIETPSGERIPMPPCLCYRSAGVFDQILFLNRARRGSRGIQFLCYVTGEIYVATAQLDQLLARKVAEFLEWASSGSGCAVDEELSTVEDPSGSEATLIPFPEFAARRRALGRAKEVGI
jgi:hypothetical protein